jgi:hypothetical protein
MSEAGIVMTEPCEQVVFDVGYLGELDDLPRYCLEALALLEMLEQLGFASEELCFALLSDGLYWMVMVHEARAIELLDGDTIYPIKAVDMPKGLQLREIYMAMIKAATRWGRAGAASRRAVLTASKVRSREGALKVELSSLELLPEPRN